ncbi:MAG: tripartite tricarboxylate transporter substrate binding protein [Betaproteobacteria bacterium]|nr:tripartite tricarboxylate transporter substrate binding protein [Betaproteobacteria bacterium]MBI2960829.1 tripartite tricarboxylate transporter substrate binding protein [Betaproteobacteria bacterium]
MRIVVSLFLALFTALAAPTAGGQDFPARPVRILVPYAPGGINDLAARILGAKLTEFWNQSVLVENRPGGNGIIAMEAAVKAKPDGYTLLMAAVGDYAITPHLYSKFPLNPLADYAPIVLVSDTSMMFAANVNAPFNTLKEMIAYANAQPGGMAYGSAGAGTLSHLTAERFAFETRTKLRHVPYKGGGPAIAALASGEVLFESLASSSALSNIKGGRAKGIAVQAPKRIPLGPDVPTVAEAGYPGFEASNWTALVAPAGTPREVIAKINADSNRALKTADVTERLAKAGSEPVGSTVEDLAAKMRAESERYGKVIRGIKLKLD